MPALVVQETTHLYLARRETGPLQQGFVLRQSYLQGGVFHSRDILDLGGDPGQVFIYDDDTSYHLDETFLDTLQTLGVTVEETQIEDLFYPYLAPYIKNRQQPFRSRSKHRNWRPADAQLRKRAMEDTHPIDQRRIHFLRLGRSTAAGGDSGKGAALYTTLLDKSRDEIEQMFMQQEMMLKPREYQSYILTTFDLSRFFTESYARTMPHALNRDQLDGYFLQEICGLAKNEQFWRGYPSCRGLQPPLIRYLLMYFDGVPEHTPDWARFAGSARSRRFNRSNLKAKDRVTRAQAFTMFGLSASKLSTMRKRDLTKMYRQKAMALHPDTGGDPELFIRLTAAYEELLPSLK